MRLEQHIYTSGKTEFTTVAMTAGISRDERLRLENASLYFLPVALHYQENILTPVKYIWYHFGENRFVVGRAVYKGKDSLGRTGNYLFHNLILAKTDLLTACYMHPVRLLKSLEQKGIFTTTVPAQPLTILEFSPDNIAAPTTALQNIPRDLLLQLLYVCVEHVSVHHPLVLIGADQECLEFLDQLYTILPYHTRLQLCVDTYAYGVSRVGFQIIGNQDESDYQQGLSASLTLYLADLRTTAHVDMPASPYLTFITEMVAAGRIQELNAVYALEYSLRTEDYPRFKLGYPALTPELQQTLWGFYQDLILKRIVTELDQELLLLIQGELAVADLSVLYATPEMLNHLVATGTEHNLQLVADWLCTPGTKTLIYPYLFKSDPLWQTLLARIRSYPQDVGFLLDLLKAFQLYYSPSFERALLETLIPLLPVIFKKKLVKEFAKAFETFPASYAEDIAILRTYVQYALSKDLRFLEKLLDSNIAVLPETSQALVFDTVLERILIVRTFELWNTNNVVRQIRQLFEYALPHPASWRLLIAAVEKLPLSKEAVKAIKTACSGLSAQPPQDREAQQIRQRIERLKPVSLLETLTYFLKG